MNKITPPNYTQVPNVIIESMGEMGNAELRVILAIVRKTFGWQKKIDRISLSQLEELTGLSRQGVIDGTTKAIENGWIKKTANGDSFDYTLLVKPVDSPSQASRPEVVKLVDTQKKLVKEKPTSEKPTRPRDELFDTIAEVCKADPQTAGSSIAKARKTLGEARPPYTPAEVRAFGEWWWGWKERKAPPSVWTLLQKIGVIRSTQGPAAQPIQTNADKSAYV